jgi:tetraprenyl-beta-curcumene synthase
MLSEQPGADRVEQARGLHQALLAALSPDVALPTVPDGRGECARGWPSRSSRVPAALDGGYLQSLVADCRRATAELPAYAAVAPAARRAAERVVAFQSYNRGYAGGDHEALERWAREATPAGSGLRWWETAASGGSSLGVHVMLAAAASRLVGVDEMDALEHAYFPWIGALHSLLDQLVDVEEDRRTGQRNLIAYYASESDAAQRMGWLAQRALERARELSPPSRHALVAAAMASFYLSAPGARAPAALPISDAVLDAFGSRARPALAVFKARGIAGRVYYASRQGAHDDHSAETIAFA